MEECKSSTIRLENMGVNIIYEIFKYLDFFEMNHLRTSNRKLYKVAKDAMVILAEREANRILLPTDNSSRNIYINKELPKHVITDSTWFDFLIEQIEKRWRIKAKLFKIIPKLFEDCEQDFNIKLTNFMFTEIKRKRMMTIPVIKNYKGFPWFTEFQELLHLHSIGETTKKYESILIDNITVPSFINNREKHIREIIDNDEIKLFEDFRFYKNSQNSDALVPKSWILCFLFWVDQFLQSHCQMIGRSISSKSSVDTFLDEYNARWFSYTYIIQIFEVEFIPFENIINEAWSNYEIRSKFSSEEHFQSPKFSILRMMWRSWAKYVMRIIFIKLKDKISELISEYLNKLRDLFLQYDELKQSQAYFDSYVQSKYSLSKLNHDLIRSSMLWVLDSKLFILLISLELILNKYRSMSHQ